MKISPFRFLVMLLACQPLAAQIVTPATPKSFKTRAIGSSADPGAIVLPAEKPNGKIRHVAHIVLSEIRMWTSTEGKPLDAKLLAFEDLAAESPAGVEPEMPKPPAHPTVVRNGKVRLLVGMKPMVISLERLSPSDCDFIAGIEAALARKAAKGE